MSRTAHKKLPLVRSASPTPEVIAEFLDGLAECQAEIAGAVATGDRKGLLQGAYRLKTASARVGATEVHALCEWIQQKALASEPAQLDQWVADLARAADLAASELNAVRRLG